MASKLCARCQLIINHSITKDQQGYYKEDWDGRNEDGESMFSMQYAIQSSKAGCDLCSRLLLEAEHFGVSVDAAFCVKHYDTKDCLGEISFHLVTHREDSFIFNVMELGELDKLGSGKGENWVDKIAETEETFSKPNIELCKKWLEKCSQHVNCVGKSRNCLPMRLLDVSGSTSQICLCLTDNLVGKEVSYMTLSHCWGDPSILAPVKLTGDRLDAYLKHIDIPSLPKTFQDAIGITRAFGCRYLWIDAFCIVQGDQEDWLKEGLRMDEIYGSSFLNIAAAWASDGRDGCFSTRDPKSVKGFMCEGGSPDNKLTVYCTMEPKQLYERYVTGTPLTSRAWVFQERHLAPRTLYFGDHQLFWECPSSIACETYPFVVNQSWSDRGFSWNKKASDTANFSWPRIIRTYSQGLLTFSSDRLIALSGVAKHFGSENHFDGTDYLAGLWRSNIVGQLAWFAESGARRSDGNIPSWSWVSVDPLPGKGIGNVQKWHFSSDKSDVLSVQLLDVVVNKVGDMFGYIRGGFLKLRCETLVKAAHYPFFQEKKRGDSDNPGLSVLYPDDTLDESLGQLFLMFHSRTDTLGTQDFSIILQATEVCGTYRRVGLRHDWHTDEEDAFQKAQDDPASRASDEDYEEVLGPDEEGKMHFVIRIV